MTQPSGERDEEALWRDIVDHYGERAHLDEPVETPDPTPDPVLDPGPPVDWHPEPDERFVAPDPGPVAWPRGRRLWAWLGVFGAPAILLVCLVAGYRLPFPLGYLLAGWFVGGFGYLVWTMPQGPPDPYDDGSRI